MRFGLRGRVLLVTVMAPLLLGVVTYVTVQHRVRAHVDSTSIHESLTHSESVFEGMLATRSRVLDGGAQVIARDPRFFSLLMLSGAQRDSRFQATVRSMADDFNRITEADLFEVFDRNGRLLASVGEARSLAGTRDTLVAPALHGRVVTGVLVESGGHDQVAVVPVRADGRIVGALMLGARIGNVLARQLRSEMRCDVTFLSGMHVTGTTLGDPVDRTALMTTLAKIDRSPAADLRTLPVLHVDGPSGTQLTIVRRMPGAPPEAQQFYVLQRAFDPEAVFQGHMQSDLVALSAVAVLAAILMGWLFSDQLLRPLRALVQAAKAMEAGDYDHPLDVRRRDELGYLATRFNVMRKREAGYVEGLERAARLKSDFIRIASQELRSPISSLVSLRDLLAEGQFGAVSADQKRALDGMREALGRLTRVADDATHTSQIQGERHLLERAWTPARKLLELVTGEVIARRAREDVKLETLGDVGDTSLPADEMRLPKALAQLVEQTLRGATAGSTVVVESTVADDRLRVVIREGAEPLELGDVVHVHPDTLGLGVAVAREVLDAHGATLRIVPQPRRATGFVVELPLAAEDDAPALHAA